MASRERLKACGIGIGEAQVRGLNSAGEAGGMEKHRSSRMKFRSTGEGWDAKWR